MNPETVAEIATAERARCVKALRDKAANYTPGGAVWTGYMQAARLLADHVQAEPPGVERGREMVLEAGKMHEERPETGPCCGSDRRRELVLEHRHHREMPIFAGRMVTDGAGVQHIMPLAETEGENE